MNYCKVMQNYILWQAKVNETCVTCQILSKDKTLVCLRKYLLSPPNQTN